MYYLINEIKDLGPFLKAFRACTEVSIDLETSGLDCLSDKIYLLTVGIGSEAFIFNLLKFPHLTYIVQLLSTKLCIGHNIKFDLKFVYVNTGELLTNVYDSQSAEILIHQGVGLQYYSLENLAFFYLNKTLDKSVRESFYLNGEVTEISEQMAVYAAEDVLGLDKIKEEQIKILTEQKQLKVLDLENKVLPVVAKMEVNGVLLDQEKWKGLMLDAESKASETKNKIILNIVDRLKLEGNCLQLADSLHIPVKTKRDRTALESITEISFIRDWLINNINIASPLQVKTIFKHLGFEIESTGEKVLLDYQHKVNDPLITLILEFRALEKKATSFGQSFLDKIHPKDNRIHSEFNQLGTTTGRFSCSGGVNLQQIVAEGDYRHSFIAPPGYKMLTVDYSGEELRVAASVTREQVMIEAFKNKIDPHSNTASIIYNKPIETIDKHSEERKIAKGFNFSIIYGVSEYGLAYNFGLKIDKAKELLDNYFKGYPTLKAVKDAYEKKVLENWYAVNPVGRRRYFERKSSFENSNEMMKYYGRVQREGFNFLVQGLSGDIMKYAMCNIHYGNTFGEDLRIIMTIHDEVVCEIKEEKAEEIKDFVVKCMLDAEQMFLKDVEAAVDYTIADYWSK